MCIRSWLLQLCPDPENSPRKVLPPLFRESRSVEIVLDFVAFVLETIRLFLPDLLCISDQLLFLDFSLEVRSLDIDHTEYQATML